MTKLQKDLRRKIRKVCLDHLTYDTTRQRDRAIDSAIELEEWILKQGNFVSGKSFILGKESR